MSDGTGECQQTRCSHDGERVRGSRRHGHKYVLYGRGRSGRDGCVPIFADSISNEEDGDHPEDDQEDRQ